MEELLGDIVNLVVLSKVCKRPPVRGFLYYFSDNEKYGVVTGNGCVVVINSEVIVVHGHHIIIE